MTTSITVEAHPAAGVVEVSLYNPAAENPFGSKNIIMEKGARQTFYVSGEENLSVREITSTTVLHAAPAG